MLTLTVLSALVLGFLQMGAQAQGGPSASPAHTLANQSVPLAAPDSPLTPRGSPESQPARPERASSSPGEASARAELVDLGSGVQALRLYARGSTGDRSVSMLLADAALLGLVLPEERANFDELVLAAGRDHALVAIVTALEPSAWEPMISFSQGEFRAAVRYPFRVQLLAGDPHLVSSVESVVAIILLPEGFNLRRPVRVEWDGSTGSITFRR